MDILEVSLLEKQFDVIECGGVLHYMDNPSEGLRKLLDILTNNGYMKLGLYSELSRKDVVKAKTISLLRIFFQMMMILKILEKMFFSENYRDK